MRIFLSCQQATRRHPVPAYSFWETYLKAGITEAGHDWIEARAVDWAEGLVYSDELELKAWRDRTWSQVLDDIRRQHQAQPIDLFLSYLFPKQVEPSAIAEIQTMGIPCVNFYCDNVRDFNRVPKVFYPFDLHWVPEFKALAFYQKANLNSIYAPMPVWIPPEQRTTEHLEHYGISFIGSRDSQRAHLLAQVVQAGVSLEIRGAGWQVKPSNLKLVKSDRQIQTLENQWRFIRSQGIIPWIRKIQEKSLADPPAELFAAALRHSPNSAEYIDIIQRSIVVLGINRYPSYHYPFSQPNTYSRMRDIEAPMMGACYLTEWTEGLDHLYDLGKEIETYKTAEELIEKIRMLQLDAEKRQQLRRRGQKRALCDHSIAKSLEKVRIALNLN